MKKTLLVAIFLATWVSNAQIKYSGTIKDSIATPLEMANVIAIDTLTKSIGSYGFSNSKGVFKLNLKANTTYNIQISYIGFKTISKFIKTKQGDILENFTMLEDKMLDEIQIVSKMPVTVKGDTIIYNADSFKNGTERKLEDVVKKIPGMEINEAGEIEVEGQKVEKVMIDGKDFFDGDTKLATKNIPANAVDKIQVLRNYGDINQLKSVQNNQDRVAINIKLKEGKKNFWFGDVTAGGGSSPDQGLYLFQPKLFYYSPKYTINVIGDLNNLGDVVLNRRDVRNFSGGFRSQSPSNGTNLSIASAGIGFLNATARNANRIETKLSAFNFSYAPNKKLDLSGFLIWSSNSNGQRNVNQLDYNDPNIPDDVTDNRTDQTSNTGLFKFSSIYKKDFNNQMNYDVIGRFSNEFRTDNASSQVIGNNITEGERATPFRINQNLSYFYTANENNIFALEMQHLLQDEDPFYVASLENNPNSNNDGFDDAADVLGLDKTVNQYFLEQDRRVKSNQLDAKLDYYYILNQKSNLNFVGGTILSRQNFDSRFFQILDPNTGATLDPNPNIQGISNPSTTNDTEYNFSDVYAGVRYRLKSGIFTFTPGFTAHSYVSKNTQFGNEFFKDAFQKILPEFEMIMQFKRSESLTFSYRQRVNFTDVNQIARGIVANSYRSFFTGNNDLLNGTIENLNLRYSSFNLFNYTNVFARVSYSKTMDPIAGVANFIPGSVVSTRTNLNAPFDNESFNAFGRIEKTFKKIRTSYFSSFNYRNVYQFFSNNTTRSKTNSHSHRISVGTNFNTAPNISLRYQVAFSDQTNTDINTNVSREFKGVTQSPSINFDAYIWNSLTFKTNFSYTEVRQNSKLQNLFKIWDATFAYRKNKDAKWEYELEASNLLGTGSRASVNTGNVVNSINETFILPRLISFRVRYQL
ncbi:carboxypeptidase-like regulatory domain-containing protein [Polaribacter aquimarinus]|uniref:TonB-dependent receptor n=1 Tax=Polaribacter aquimarinus TaxID=2100726 RepID=A0A2U2J6V9_9FLAO|nr:carboxypeptidase-like regulatory domain-containing protein [Polaribacter aquimarinus]PWG04070.1 TonB-dependent receptor [Polaribacter aquimarinus]